MLLFCVCSRGHHQGSVPECEVQPPQGVRRTGLPEGHVCQSQETGAKVRVRFSAKSSVEEFPAWTVQTFLWRWCQKAFNVRLERH